MYKNNFLIFTISKIAKIILLFYTFSRKYLKLHFNDIHYNGVKCKVCLEKFNSIENLKNHYTFFHQTGVYECSLCKNCEVSLQKIYVHFKLCSETYILNKNIEHSTYKLLITYKGKFKTIDETMNNVLEKAFKAKIKLIEITTKLSYLQSLATFKNKQFVNNFSQTCVQKNIISKSVKSIYQQTYISNNKIINIFQQTNKNTTKTNLKNASLKNVIFTQNSDAVFGNINLSYGFNCNNLNKKTKSKINNESQNDNTMKLILNLAVKTEFKLKNINKKLNCLTFFTSLYNKKEIFYKNITQKNKEKIILQFVKNKTCSSQSCFNNTKFFNQSYKEEVFDKVADMFSEKIEKYMSKVVISKIAMILILLCLKQQLRSVKHIIQKIICAKLHQFNVALAAH